MEIVEHPRGRIITLGRGEAFVVTDPRGGPSLRAEIVTTFARTTADEPEPYFTVAGNELSGIGRFNELPLRFHDVGLLPPHVRRHVQGIDVLDFGDNLASTATVQAHAIQAGLLPTEQIDSLPRKAPAFKHAERRSAEHIAHLRSLPRPR